MGGIRGQVHQELAGLLHQWRRTNVGSPPRPRQAQGSMAQHQWFTRLTCQQQALLLALAPEEEPALRWICFHIRCICI